MPKASKATTTPRPAHVAIATPRVKADIMASLATNVDQAIRDHGNGIKGADLARILMATGHLSTKGNPGLVLRTYMRSHGAWVGQGRTYGMTMAEARRVAAGFIGKVPPPKGVRYAKGTRIVAQDNPTPDEVATAA